MEQIDPSVFRVNVILFGVTEQIAPPFVPGFDVNAAYVLPSKPMATW